MQRIIKTILLISIGLFFSCTLFRPKCPIPNCKIRQEHRHALTFSEDVKKGKWSLKKQGEKWAQENDTTLQNNLDNGGDQIASTDSSGTPHEEKLSRKEKKRRKKLEKELAKAEKEEQERKEAEELAAQNALLDNPQAPEEDSELSKKQKKDKKKSKKDKGLSDEEKLAMEEELYADDSEYHSSDTDALTDEELAEQEKISDQEAKAAEKAGKEEGEDILTYWRSRITEWFRKNQKPKIGEYWKKPKQN